MIDRRLLVRYLVPAVLGAMLRATAVLTLVPLLTALFDGTGAWGWTALFAAAVVCGWAVEYAVAHTGFAIGFGLLNGLETRLLDRLQRVPLGWFTTERKAEGQRALTSSGRELCQSITHLVTPAVNALAMPLLIGLGLLAFSPALGLVALAAVPVLLGALWASMRCVRAADDAYAAASGEAGTRIVELARAQAALRAAGRAGTDGTAVGRALDRQRRAVLRLVGFGLPGHLLFGLAAQGVLIALAVTAVASAGSAATVVALLIVGVRFIEPFTTLADLSPALQALRGTLARVRELLNAPVLTGDDREPLTGAPAVELRDVHFAHEPGRPVLSGVSLTVERGTTTAIVGPSGAGKTTLLSLIARFHEASAGTVLVGGHDVTALDPAVHMGRLGIVFQDVYLFDATLRANIALGRPGATDGEIAAAASTARLDELVERLPGGWETRVGDRGAALSGGERQRVSIARALLKDAPLLLLDEATAALDNANEAAIIGALDARRDGRATVIVAHRLSTIARADRIVFLEEGRVVESGSLAELLASGGRFAGYWARREAAAGWTVV
ncbi:ABC transporter ATP-binding protein [Actinorhabdospora filicis]|uniref:ABC transporter ATP-binding protein n=1 Tax=Actinorhabdospora filicis TaxID=1785913 RepID=A0A9W6SKS1_9ACTN|nr:ABC transporter ATP-binding protein [Actinorhabdospora filicis]GLZ77803.1 ABC transporter ATP-binding protein [Actinorhabdospora filicis]